MKTLGLCILAALSLSACTTGMNSRVLTSPTNKIIMNRPEYIGE